MDREALDRFDERAGETLSEYDHLVESQRQADHVRTQEADNWYDLCIMVNGGLISQEEAQARHIAWLQSRP